MSLDCIGLFEGIQFYYVIVLKCFGFLRFLVYVSFNYFEWDSEFNFLFGVELVFFEVILVWFMYDGVRFYFMINYFGECWSLSFLVVDFEYLGLFVVFGF